ncbi:MAG: CheR family methyltransferase, partial [Planctomycetota bacterium]
LAGVVRSLLGALVRGTPRGCGEALGCGGGRQGGSRDRGSGHPLQHELRRGIRDQQRDRFFRSISGSPTSGPSWQLTSEVRSQVRFSVESLTETHSALLKPNSIDVLLCRNVLIYFDGATRAQIVSRLADALRPNGLFLLGSAEMLRDCKDRFTGEKIGATQWQRKRS